MVRTTSDGRSSSARSCVAVAIWSALPATIKRLLARSESMRIPCASVRADRSCRSVHTRSSACACESTNVFTCTSAAGEPVSSLATNSSTSTSAVGDAVTMSVLVRSSALNCGVANGLAPRRLPKSCCSVLANFTARACESVNVRSTGLLVGSVPFAPATIFAVASRICSMSRSDAEITSVPP